MTDTITKKDFSKRLYIYKVGNIALTLMCGLLCAICTLFFYDEKPGYFALHPLISIFYVAIALTVLFAISTVITFNKTFKLEQPTSKGSSQIISIIPACAFILYAISLTPTAFEGSSKSKAALLQMFFALAAFLYFFIIALDISSNQNLLAILGIASLGCPILIAINSYFDYSSVMNGPDKLFMQFAVVLFSLYLINELRFILNKSYSRFYITVAILTSSVAIISFVFKICTLASNRKLQIDNLALAGLLASIGVYTALRLILAKESPDSGIEPQEETANKDSNTESDTSSADEESNIKNGESQSDINTDNESDSKESSLESASTDSLEDSHE